MGLQTQRLVMVGLGVLGDTPPNALQPALPDGVHLRWAFEREAGFPWYGYYLYRRRHLEGERVCLGPHLVGQEPRTLPTRVHATRVGTLSSDRPLVLTDDFAPVGQVELDLAERGWLRLTLPPGEPAQHALVLIGFPAGTVPTPIEVTAYSGPVQVDKATVDLSTGLRAEVHLMGDAITAIQLSSGPAALIDVCYVPVAASATAGWEPLPEAPAPLALPVLHPRYPASGGRPVDAQRAEEAALRRVTYGDARDWAGEPFADLHEQLLVLVDGGPGGPSMAERVLPDATGVPAYQGSSAEPPTLTGQSPLSAVLLGALHPPIAQMLGLYWADRTAPPDSVFDYMVVADHRGLARGNPLRLLEGLRQHGFGEVDAWIAFRLVSGPAAPLEAPTGVRVYALPGGTWRARNGSLARATGHAGLRWDRPPASNTAATSPLDRTPVLYHVWRSFQGSGPFPMNPLVPELRTGDGPVLVSRTDPTAGEQALRTPGWPPFQLHHLDLGVSKGWWGYSVSGIDLFGRHSALSDPADWYQWGPEPDPRPWWYQDPPGERLLAPGIIRMLDKAQPPPPAALAAWALDPADPFVQRDAAYDAWFASLTQAERQSVVGLRVRWDWTDAQMRQAPYVTEFRVYWQPDQPNTSYGRAVTVTTVSPSESLVVTDLHGPVAEDALAEATLRSGGRDFPVTGNEPGSPLTPRVRHVGPTHTAGTATVRAGSATVTGTGTSWHAGLVGLSFQPDGATETATILQVDSPTSLVLREPWSGTGGTGGYTIFDGRPRAGEAVTLVIPENRSTGTVNVVTGSAAVIGSGTAWDGSLAGQWLTVQGTPGRWRVASVDAPNQLTLDRPFAGQGGTALPYTVTHPLAADPADPVTWVARVHVVGFSEHVTVTTDADGLPLRRYELFLPAPGAPVRLGLPLDTSPAAPILYGQVGVSAADASPDTTDHPRWAATPFGDRPGNEGPVAGPATVVRVHREAPGAPVPPPPQEGRRVYATPADYHGRSYHTYRWQPTPDLLTHVFRALDDAVAKADWAQRPRAPLTAAQLAWFPDEAIEPRWDQTLRELVATQLNQLNDFSHDPAGSAEAMACYQALPDDALRVLAGLPGCERAFSQRTIDPLDPDDAACADRLGPDDPADRPRDPALRAYVDTLDGRANNRYLYRAAAVDRAHNRGPLGLASPPVWLPDVTSPARPALLAANGGDRSVTLRWVAGGERDLDHYLLYRTDSVESARDPRLMTLRAQIAAGPRRLEVHDEADANVLWHYLLVAVDSTGNASEPSAPVAGRAYQPPPVPPDLDEPTWDAAHQQVTLTWSSPDPDLETQVERRDRPGTSWQVAARWLPRGQYTYVDTPPDPATAFTYRLKVRDTLGQVNSTYQTRTTP